MDKKALRRIRIFQAARILSACMLLSACQPAPTTHHEAEEIAQDSTAMDTLPADFIEFYEAFNNDSAYQLAHIVFPLSTTLTDTAGLDSSVTWTAETWKLHQPFVADDFWDHQFEIPVEGVITEVIYARDGPFYLQRRFARSNRKWYLIYYSGLKSRSPEWE